MTLVELSRATNQPIQKLKNVIQDEFGIIILSEYNTVQDSIVKRFAGNGFYRSNNKRNDPDAGHTGENGFVRGSRCLDELIDLQDPAVSYTKKLLRYCVENKYLIFIDTCSLLNDNFDDFYKLFKEQKGTARLSLYIPYVVVEELKRIAVENRKQKDTVEKAVRVLQFIQAEEAGGSVVMVGDENDKRKNERGEMVIHADRVIIEKLIFFRNDSRNSLFITQDYDVTVDALKQNDWHSSRSSALILVKKISRGGALIDNTKETVNPILPID